jgi:predicted esterase
MHRTSAAVRLCGVLAGAWLLLAAATGPAAAQQGAPAGADALRERLAEGYLRLELALHDATAAGAPAGGPERRRLNQAFDALTLQFFAGNLTGALASLDTLVTGVAPAATRGTLHQRAQEALQWLATQRRTLDTGGSTTPFLLHVPERPAPDGGWPVVVAVHGAGGDERMFFGGYGAGVIRALADAHGVAVITPRAPLTTDAIIALVDGLSAGEALDAGRVALLGHSMGAAVVGRAALERPDRFRAVACIAGSCGTGVAAGAPPALLVAGALDPLFRIDNLAAQAAALGEGGRDVVFRRYDDEGHTLVVGAALPGAVEWLAGHLAAGAVPAGGPNRKLEEQP